jgi:hypothetical protein
LSAFCSHSSCCCSSVMRCILREHIL